MKKLSLLSLTVIIISFMISFYYYSFMPEEIVSRWNISGEANSYLPKLQGLFLMPLLMLTIFSLIKIIPTIDPLGKNIKRFKTTFDIFILIFLIFMLYVHILSVLWNIGIKLNMINFIIPAIGILFFYLGTIMNKLKPNWFIGIKTPWTLSNKIVWKKTHKLASKLFKIVGIFIMISIFFPKELIFYNILFSILILLSLIPYSYFEYKKIIK